MHKLQVAGGRSRWHGVALYYRVAWLHYNLTNSTLTHTLVRISKIKRKVERYDTWADWELLWELLRELLKAEPMCNQMDPGPIHLSVPTSQGA